MSIPVVFVALTLPPFGENFIYPGMFDAMDCAVRNSGAKVFLISDQYLPCHRMVTQIPISSIGLDLKLYGRYARIFKASKSSRLDGLNTASTFRWICLLGAMRSGWIPESIMCIDYDVLLFSSTEEACEPFAGNDIICAKSSLGKTAQCPSVLLGCKALEEVVRNINNDIFKHRRFSCDMGFWNNIYNSGRYECVNAELEHQDSQSTFDGNIGCDTHSQFECDPDGYKSIFWHGRKPYFKRRIGGLVRAHTIHCWGKYKSRTAELNRKNMGLIERMKSL